MLLPLNGFFKRLNVNRSFSGIYLYYCANESRAYEFLDGNMTPQMKQSIRSKIESYVKRAEEIKGFSKKGSNKKAVADGANGRGNGKDNKDDDESGDPERKKMIQKFEGKLLMNIDLSNSHLLRIFSI